MPKTSKIFTVTKRSEEFTDFLRRVLGIRMTPLACVVRESTTLERTLPVLVPNSLRIEDHGSTEEEMAEFASHTHWIFRNDSASVLSSRGIFTWHYLCLIYQTISK